MNKRSITDFILWWFVDEISVTQQAKFIPYLFRISYPYQHRAACVKPKLEHLWPLWPVIEAFNLTFLGNRYAEGRCQYNSFQSNRVSCDLCERCDKEWL